MLDGISPDSNSQIKIYEECLGGFVNFSIQIRFAAP